MQRVTKHFGYRPNSDNVNTNEKSKNFNTDVLLIQYWHIKQKLTFSSLLDSVEGSESSSAWATWAIVEATDAAVALTLAIGPLLSPSNIRSQAAISVSVNLAISTDDSPSTNEQND